jgi:hypothetical protein
MCSYYHSSTMIARRESKCGENATHFSPQFKLLSRKWIKI